MPRERAPLSWLQAYTAGIVRNHPFVDGDKRTGVVVGVLFLELNGFRFIASEESATQAMLDLAAGRLDEGDFKLWLGANVRRELHKKQLQCFAKRTVSRKTRHGAAHEVRKAGITSLANSSNDSVAFFGSRPGS
jgi:Fic/DOC family protein